MKADRESFIEKIRNFSLKSFFNLALSMYDELEEKKLKILENERIITEMTIQFSEANKRICVLESENKNLKLLYEKEIEKNNLKVKSTFGRKTEGILSMLNEAQTEPEDESEVEETEKIINRKRRIIDFDKAGNERPSIRRKEKKGPTLSQSMDHLPKKIDYEIDIDELNKQYGKGQWRISYWHEHRSLMKIDNPFYTQVNYTPVISIGLEHEMITLPYMNPLIDKSFISPSIIADVLYRKFALGLPYYRQARDYRMHGVALSKQTMIHWVNTLVPDIGSHLHKYMVNLLLHYHYIQSDETYIQVNKDGYGPGHKSYYWVHATSEFLDSPPIIIFCYELTRSTDHLRDYFQEFLGYITCDAYISYQVVENESEGKITTTGCFMHCRRYFAEAFFVRNVTEMSDEELKALPETKVLLLIREIYQIEGRLKEMSAEERTKARKERVAPKVHRLFAYIRSLENSNEIYTDRMKKAIQYALNQEEHLCRFLEDGNIPCDNGYVERIIRSYSIGRANWLFADTIDGAKVNAIMYSIVETAKANGANVQIYLEYLFEKMTKHRNEHDEDFLADMMPWSDAYKQYEKDKQQKQYTQFDLMFQKPKRPRTPRKKDLLRVQTDTSKEPMMMAH